MIEINALAVNTTVLLPKGLRRFWMNVDTWSEGWEDDDFFAFVTGRELATSYVLR